MTNKDGKAVRGGREASRRSKPEADRSSAAELAANRSSAAELAAAGPRAAEHTTGVLSAVGAHASAQAGGGPGHALSETLEDYLEIILALALENPTVRVRDIARAKGVRMPSVTAALRRLKEKALVSYRAREYVGLTTEGEAIAQRLAGRHRFLTRFLHELLCVSATVAERDACGLEHHLSAESLDRLAAFVEYIDTCPEVGAEFLTRFQTCFTQPVVGGSCGGACSLDRPCERHLAGRRSIYTLRSLPPGARGELVRIRASGGVRGRLMRQGLLPGSRIAKQAGEAGRGPTVVRVQGQRIELTAREAAVILVELDSEDERGRA